MCGRLEKKKTKQKQNKETIKTWRWWRWWWWRENNRNVVVVAVVVVEEENNRILWLENLYKSATFYPAFSVYILLLTSWHDMSWFWSVCENLLVERIVCKGTWCLNTSMLVSPNFKQFRLCCHRNVSGFASSILLPPWLPEWPGPEKQHGFGLYYSKFQRQFTFPRR